MPTTRRKAGEALMEKAVAQEGKLRQKIAELQMKKKTALDKRTGKLRAMSAVKHWLNNLNTTELRYELNMHSINMNDFESLEEAVNEGVEKMFFPSNGLDAVVTGNGALDSIGE